MRHQTRFLFKQLAVTLLNITQTKYKYDLLVIETLVDEKLATTDS